MARKKLGNEDFFIREALPFLGDIPGVVAWRQHKGWYYKKGVLRHGIADIMGIKNGTPFAIEVKASKGEAQSEYQKIFQKDFESAGGVYILVRNLEEVVTFMEKI